MAAKWLASSENLRRNFAVLVATGAVVGITAYILYRQKKRRKPSTDLSQPPANQVYRDKRLITPPPVDKKVLVMGLRGAGKSTLLLLVTKKEDKKKIQPTEGFHVMCIENNGRPINVWEVGGSEAIRKYWYNFIQDTDMFVYVVDSADRDKLEESGEALRTLLADQRLDASPALVVFNKQDLEGVVERKEILEKMGLTDDVLGRYIIEFIDTQVPPNGEMKGHEEFIERILKLDDSY